MEEFAYLAGWCLCVLFVVFLIFDQDSSAHTCSCSCVFQSGRIHMNKDFVYVILFTHESGWAGVEGRWGILWNVFKRLG